MISWFIPGDHLLQRQARAGPGEEGADSGGQRGARRHQADGPAVPQRKTDGMVQFSGVVVAKNNLQFSILQKFPDLKFKYVEEEQPEDFFVPYVWTLVARRIYWNPKSIKLFEPRWRASAGWSDANLEGWKISWNWLNGELLHEGGLTYPFLQFATNFRDAATS